MKKTLLICILFLLIMVFQARYDALSELPIQGEYAFGIEYGPKVVSLGDAQIVIPENASMMKFSAPAQSENNKQIQGHFGILTLEASPMQNDISSIYYSYLKTGYTPNPTLKLDEMYATLEFTPQNQEEEWTLFILEEVPSYMIRLPNPKENKTSFLGLIPSRQGILTVSTETQSATNDGKKLFAFHETMQKISFLNGSSYSDYEKGDPVYENTLAVFLKEFNLMQSEATENIPTKRNQNKESSSKSTLQNIFSSTLRPDPNASFAEDPTNPSLSSMEGPQNPWISSSNGLEKKYPWWVIYLGIALVLSGGIKGTLQKMKTKQM
jgi:hypothetical protein